MEDNLHEILMDERRDVFAALAEQFPDMGYVEQRRWLWDHTEWPFGELSEIIDQIRASGAPVGRPAELPDAT